MATHTNTSMVSDCCLCLLLPQAEPLAGCRSASLSTSRNPQPAACRMCRLDTAVSDVSSSPSSVVAARVTTSFSLGTRIASTSASMPPAQTTLPTRCGVITSTCSNTTTLNRPFSGPELP
ncbi:hypothetical protein BX661DRAFT_183663 [Kickxella alabastrina]|uniref:uncharacterized protein n=1 Tax=Kickxella alabastrina TaxID=61397 RepID=UPI00221E4C39|nr:uncharacterized protein BX661DRAFT_183663 [Kickxella alabastrina]KAI7826858.1 hypothetical protein BX661DRAFT_183663 [Kickxella alabastrina]